MVEPNYTPAIEPDQNWPPEHSWTGSGNAIKSETATIEHISWVSGKPTSVGQIVFCGKLSPELAAIAKTGSKTIARRLNIELNHPPVYLESAARHAVDDVFSGRKEEASVLGRAILLPRRLFPNTTYVELRQLLQQTDHVAADAIVLFVKKGTKYLVADFEMDNLQVVAGIPPAKGAELIEHGADRIGDYGTTTQAAYSTIFDLLPISPKEAIGQTESAKAELYDTTLRPYFPRYRLIDVFSYLSSVVAGHPLPQSMLHLALVKKNEIQNQIGDQPDRPATKIAERISISSVLLVNRPPPLQFVDLRVLFELLRIRDDIALVALRTSTKEFVKQGRDSYELYGTRLAEDITSPQKNALFVRIRFTTNKSSPLYNVFFNLMISPHGIVEIDVYTSDEHNADFDDIEHALIVGHKFVAALNEKIGYHIFSTAPLTAVQPDFDTNIKNLNFYMTFRPGTYQTFTQYLSIFSPYITRASADEFGADNKFLINRPLARHTRGQSHDQPANIGLFPVTFYWSGHSAKANIIGAKSRNDVEELIDFFNTIVGAFTDPSTIADRDLARRVESIRSTERLRDHDENRSKRLQLLDPKTYAYHKLYPDEAPYTIKCQRKREPIVYTEAEFRNLPERIKTSALKFRSASSGNPLFYSCHKNGKFKFPSFLPRRKHPESLCQICCQIENPRDTSKVGKRSLFNDCMGTPQPIESKVSMVTMKYIYAYTPNLSTNRFADLPPLLERLVNVDLPVKNLAAYKMFGASTGDVLYDLPVAVFCALNSIDISSGPPDIQDVKRFLSDCIDFIEDRGIFTMVEKGRLADIYETSAAYRAAVMGGDFRRADRTTMFKMALELFTKCDIIVLRATQPELVAGQDPAQHPKDSGDIVVIHSGLRRSNTAIILIHTEEDCYFPIYNININRYSTNHSNFASLINTVFDDTDKIVQRIMDVIGDSAAIDDTSELLVSADGTSRFVKKAGQIIPTNEYVIGRHKSVIKSHSDLENETYKPPKSAVPLSDGKNIFGYLDGGLITYIGPGKRAGNDSVPIVNFAEFDKINDRIRKAQASDERTASIKTLRDSLAAYDMVRAAFSREIRRQRNGPIRKKISAAYAECEGDREMFAADITSFVPKDDIDLLMEHFLDVPEVLATFAFHFDNVTRLAVEAALDNDDKIGAASAVRDVFDDVVSVTKSVIAAAIDPIQRQTNLIITCGEMNQKATRCTGEKVILTPDEYRKFLRRIIDDVFDSSLLRMTLLSGVSQRVVDENEFGRAADTIVYVRDGDKIIMK
jgi:hypothetical protein